MQGSESAPVREIPRKRSAALACGVLLAVFVPALFLPVLKGGFVHSDPMRLFGAAQEQPGRDQADPYGETRTRGKPGEAAAPRMDAMHPPVFTAVLQGAVPLFKYHERPYHVLNLGLHCASVLLLYALILAATGHAVRANEWLWAGAAALGAALFAAHPGAAGVAAWLWAMPQALAGALLLASTLLFVRAGQREWRSRGGYAASVVLYGLGQFASPGALLWFLVPVALALPQAPRRGAVLARAVPLVLLSAAAAYLYYSWNAFGAGYGPGAFFERAGAYLRSLAVVWRIAPVHPAPVPGAGSTMIITGAAGCAALAVALAWGAARRWHPALCGALAAILAAALSHAFIAQPFLSDEGPYLAYAGLGMAAAVIGAAAAAPDPRRLSRISAAPMVLAAVLVIVASCAAARTHIFTFRSNATFWSHLAEDSGRAPIVLYYHSRAQMQEGNFSAAAHTLADAYDKSADDPAFQKTLARAMFALALKLYDEKPQHYSFAKQFLIKCVDMNPLFPYAYSTLAGVYMDKEKRYFDAYVNMLIARELALDKEAMDSGLAEVIERADAARKPIDRAKGRRLAETWLRSTGAFTSIDRLAPDPPVSTGKRAFPRKDAQDSVAE